VVSLAEYLATSYDLDVEYVDGVLVERNMGPWLHSLVQANSVVALDKKYPDLYVLPAVRCQTSPSRFRLPDVCMLLTRPEGRFVAEAPFLVIEVLSEEDRMSSTLEKLEEYRQKGVLHIWVIDPRLQRMFVSEAKALREVDVFRTDNPLLELTREEVFRRIP
jgi:Uma2 family endonuclease